MATTDSKADTAPAIKATKRSFSAGSTATGDAGLDLTTVSIVAAQDAELARLLTQIDAGLDEIDRIQGRSTRASA